MVQLVAGALELPTDVHLRAVIGHIWPGESERLAAPKAQDANQHECGIERVIVTARGLQESPGLIDRPPLPLLLAGRRSRTMPATLRVSSSSATAVAKAARSVFRASLTVQSEIA
jgi:hypothetical protein